MNQFPKDFAEAVISVLKLKASVSVKPEVLIDLFESMFFASFKTEESDPIVFHIVYIDPDEPDPNPPKNMPKDRWSYVRFAKPIPVNVSNLIKIAKASDPRTSSLAIYAHEKGRLAIWGLIDQGNRYHDFVNYDLENAPERPGIFQASVVATGHLVAYKELWKIAELINNKVLRNSIDVFGSGPVRGSLEDGIESYIQSVKRKVTAQMYNDRSHWDESLSSYWIASLCRLILRIQNYHHGGALLITSNSSLRGLNIKYQIDYVRLRGGPESKAITRIEEVFASDRIFSDYMDQDLDEVPMGLYLDETVNRNKLAESMSEIDGSIWFISLLSRVDGLVLMNAGLEVKGFGVEITGSKEPPAVFLAGDRNATKTKLKEVDYNHYGTRHRSMMRYCSTNPKSIGFVISQDGDVRVMTKVHEQLVMWENLRLQHHYYLPRRKRRKAH